MKKMKDDSKKSRLLMMLSMTIFGTISLFVRYLPLASGEIALFRSVIAALSIGLIFLFKKQKGFVRANFKNMSAMRMHLQIWLSQ